MTNFVVFFLPKQKLLARIRPSCTVKRNLAYLQRKFPSTFPVERAIFLPKNYNTLFAQKLLILNNLSFLQP